MRRAAYNVLSHALSGAEGGTESFDPSAPLPTPFGRGLRRAGFAQGACVAVLLISVLMTACAIAKSDIWETTKVNLPFIFALFVVLMLCTYVPWFSLALVEVFYGK